MNSLHKPLRPISSNFALQTLLGNGKFCDEEEEVVGDVEDSRARGREGGQAACRTTIDESISHASFVRLSVFVVRHRLVQIKVKSARPAQVTLQTAK